LAGVQTEASRRSARQTTRLHQRAKPSRGPTGVITISYRWRCFQTSRQCTRLQSCGPNGQRGLFVRLLSASAEGSGIWPAYWLTALVANPRANSAYLLIRGATWKSAHPSKAYEFDCGHPKWCRELASLWSLWSSAGTKTILSAGW